MRLIFKDLGYNFVTSLYDLANCAGAIRFMYFLLFTA